MSLKCHCVEINKNAFARDENVINEEGKCLNI